MTTILSNSGLYYLYAVIPGTQQKDLDLKGIFDSTVKTVTEQDISAVVSEIPETGKLRPERRNLAAHQKVLSRLVENGGVVLPVSFGTVAENEKGIREMLSKYQKTFLEQIKKVSGKVEMELRVIYEVPNVFEYYVSKYPELKEQRDKVYGSNREPTREEKIDLGQLFERIQNQEREDQTGKIEHTLCPPCVEMKRNKPRNEKEVMRISCLVEKDAVEKFQSKVDEASKLFDDNFTFEYSGPVPPYNFVDVRVKV
jgi:hypothetical protein